MSQKGIFRSQLPKAIADGKKMKDITHMQALAP